MINLPLVRYLVYNNTKKKNKIYMCVCLCVHSSDTCITVYIVNPFKSFDNVIENFDYL